MNIVLVGIQGSGKGTQAARILERYDCIGFDMGLALRTFAEGDSDEARRTKQILEGGNLVPTSLAARLLDEFIRSMDGRAVILDGVIRSPEQNAAMIEVIGGDMMVLHFALDEETAIARLLGRMIDPVTKEIFGPGVTVNPKTGNVLIHRSDDTIEAIRSRIEWSKRDTLPLVEVWRSEGYRIETIDASQDTDQVFADICAILDPIVPLKK